MRDTGRPSTTDRPMTPTGTIVLGAADDIHRQDVHTVSPYAAMAPADDHDRQAPTTVHARAREHLGTEAGPGVRGSAAGAETQTGTMLDRLEIGVH